MAEVDLRKCEIRSAWRIASGGVAANGVCVSDGMIYVATSAGLYRADLSSRVLEDYGQWTLLPDPAGGVASVVAFAGGVVAAVGEVGGECSLWRLTGSVAEMVTTVSSFRGLDASASRLAVVSSGRVDVFDSGRGAGHSRWDRRPRRLLARVCRPLVAAARPRVGRRVRRLQL